MIDKIIKEFISECKKAQEQLIRKVEEYNNMIKELENHNSELYSKLIEYQKIVDKSNQLARELEIKERQLNIKLKRKRKKLYKKYDKNTVRQIIKIAGEKLWEKYCKPISDEIYDLNNKKREIERELYEKYGFSKIYDLLYLIDTAKIYEKEEKTDSIKKEVEKIISKIEKL